jgi:RNA polymerase sigma factor (sigma-70 family)
MIDDATLLDRYSRERSEAAFSELVQRHLTLVYSAALRRTGGDAHRAKDVAQIVFTALARGAAALSGHAALTGWFYAATRNAAIDLMRAERRRQVREEKAHIMEEILSSGEPPADWEQLRPVLDEAMDELDERDREAVLLRFFEGRPLAVVANALRVSEDAARKRVDRALDKLGGLLARRGITSTGGALAVLLANQTSVAAPAGVAASIAAAAMAGATAAGVSAGAAGILIMSTSKAVMGITAVIAAVAIGSAVYQAKLSHTAEAAVSAIGAERDDLRTRLAAVEKRAQQTDAQLAATQQDLSVARVAATKPPEPASPRPAAPSQGVAMDYVLEHPETHTAFIEERGMRTKARYDRFFKTAGLSTEQQDKLLKGLKEVGETELDLMVALRSQGLGVGNMPQDPETQAGLTRIAMEQKQRVAAELRATLGDDGFRAFQQYSATIPERNVTDQMASQLYYTDEPLTASQANQLAQILAQNRFAPQPTPSPANTMNGTVITPKALVSRAGQVMQQGGMTMLDWTAPVTDAAVTRAEAVLTPTQLAALKRVQAQQVAQIQIAPPPPSAGSRQGSVPGGGM